MGILDDFMKRKSQELRNDVPTAETETPSQQSTDDPTNNLEFVDKSDQKRNRTHGPHGESVNKTAQTTYIPKHGDRVRFLKDSDNGDLPTNAGDSGTVHGSYSDSSEWISVDKDDGEGITVHVRNIEPLDGEEGPQAAKQPTPVSEEEAYKKRRDEMMRQKLSVKNPFHIAQVVETGHDDGELNDQETAETGHIGSGDPKMRYDQGGRSLGREEDPSKHTPVHHDRETNSQKEQIT